MTRVRAPRQVNAGLNLPVAELKAMLEHVDLQATGSSSGLMQLFTKIEQIGSMGQASGLFLCLIALYSALLLCRGVYGGLYERLRSFPLSLSPWGRPWPTARSPTSVRARAGRSCARVVFLFHGGHALCGFVWARRALSVTFWRLPALS